MRKWRCLLLSAIALLAASPELARVALSIAPSLRRHWWLPTGVVILGVLGGYALHRVRLARLLELERVRMRIATDLHDDIGASLTQIAILTEVAQRQLTVLDPAVVEPIARVSSISRELVDSMSEIVWAINPRHDRLSDLAAHMRRFASDVLMCRHIAIAFDAPHDILNVPMGADHRRQCFLAFKEAIHNTVRHADCTEVVVGIARAGRSLIISVRDDGAGFDPRQASEGHGIRSMQARARTIGGRLEIVSRPNAGTTVRFIMPLHHRSFPDVRLPGSLWPTRITRPVSVDALWRCLPRLGARRGARNVRQESAVNARIDRKGRIGSALFRQRGGKNGFEPRLRRLLTFWLSRALLSVTATQTRAPVIWDDAALADWATPIAALQIRPGHYKPAEYYAVPGGGARRRDLPS